MENEETQYEPVPELSEPGIIKETRCEHFLVMDPSQDPNSNMISVVCVNEGCWHGASFDPEQSELVNGTIQVKEK